MRPGDQLKRGEIRSFGVRRGFGFLADAETGCDLFFHATAIAKGWQPESGDACVYVHSRHNGKPVAVDVRPV